MPMMRNAMKCLVVFASVVTLVHGEGLTPQITLALSHGENGKIGALEPHLKWTTNGETPVCDYEAGLDVRVEDFESLPYSVWGKLKKKVKGWNLSVRGVVDSFGTDAVDLDVRAQGSSTEIQFLASAGVSSSSLDKINVKQGIKVPGGQVVLNPRYSLENSKLDATIAYDMDTFGIKVDGSKNDQKLTLSKKIGQTFRIVPSVTRSGVVALDVEHQLTSSSSSSGVLTASFRPNDSINLKWEDGPWLANMNAPIDGYWVDGVNVSVKRKVDI